MKKFFQKLKFFILDIADKFSVLHKYEGEYRDGQRHGKGIYTFPSGKKYEGEFRFGEFHGQGILKTRAGSSFSGYFKGGYLNGLGKFSNIDESYVYEGEFLDGYFHGQGTENWKNVIINEGEFKNGQLDGEGKRIFVGVSTCVGAWKKGEPKKLRECVDSKTGECYLGEFWGYMRHGFGALTFPNGARYEGRFKYNELDGPGKFIFPDGDFFDGIFKKNKFIKGIIKNKKGEEVEGQIYLHDRKYNGEHDGKYIGEMKNGQPDGRGKFTYIKRSQFFEGTWILGRKNGIGRFVKEGLVFYEGQYKDDYIHGMGKQILGTKIFEGEFVKSEFKNGTVKYANGTIFTGDWTWYKSVNGILEIPGILRYEGEFFDGEITGQGIVDFLNGQKYKGEFEEGKCHGKGSYIFSENEIFTGDFLDNILSSSRLFFPNGTRYVGKYTFNESTNLGTLITADGCVYIGVFDSDGMLVNGQFKEHYLDEEPLYTGEFKNLKFHGYGKMIFSTNSSTYEGVWDEGSFRNGIQIFGDGTRYEGEVDENYDRNGIGTLTDPEEGSYAGNWVSSKKHGMGKMTYKNGSIYEGMWVDDMRQGRGVMIKTDGTTIHGIWEKNEFLYKT
jgi:hypothetical protein